MKTIKLTREKVTVVDDDVYEWASKFKWHAHKNRYGFYAARSVYSLGKGKKIFLHREIVRPGHLKVDHRDGDGLNNLRQNLRPATLQQNHFAYRTPKTNTTSRFRGVCWHRVAQKWLAQIRFNWKRIYIGLFEQEEKAALAYDQAAKKYFGEFASCNFPEKRKAVKV